MARRRGYPLLKSPATLGMPTVERQHLMALAFLAALGRTRGIALDSADAIYIAGYEAKRLQLGRHPQPFERDKLRRAANRIWDALQSTSVPAPHVELSPALATQGGLPWASR